MGNLGFRRLSDEALAGWTEEAQRLRNLAEAVERDFLAIHLRGELRRAAASLEWCIRRSSPPSAAALAKEASAREDQEAWDAMMAEVRQHHATQRDQTSRGQTPRDRVQGGMGSPPTEGR